MIVTHNKIPVPEPIAPDISEITEIKPKTAPPKEPYLNNIISLLQKLIEKNITYWLR
jgi:hypothetical protein